MSFDMSLRILIDAHLIGSHETGNESYTINLLQSLSKLPNIICGAAILPDSKLPSYLSGIEPLTLSTSGNWGRLLYGLNTICRKWQADILHVNYVGPFFVSCPMVVTVHDVAFKRYPNFFSLRDRLLFATLLPLTMRRASSVITVSNHAKQEIIKFFPVAQNKLHVTLEASDQIFHPIQEKELLAGVKSRYGICSEFILAVGNLQPRKNLLRLITAFASVHKQFESIQLVIVGKAHRQTSSIYETVQHFGLEQNVIFTGYVPDDDLILLYNAAKVYVYPSIYEGFGLPILEAMACGTPVVTSNTSSMPEVAGEAALLVDPLQEDQIAQAIVQILSNPDLATSLSKKGLKHVQRFSWNKTALDTLAVYQKLMKQHPF